VVVTAKVESIEVATPEGRFGAHAAGSMGAPLVVLLHGFPHSRHTWRDVLPALATGGFRGIAPDQRGYSPGVRPTSIEAYRSDRLVEDVLDIMDALGARKAHLVGHDWGGQVAWLVAAHHPDRVTSLCALSRPHPAAFARALLADPHQATRSGHHRSFTAPEMTDQLQADGGAALRGALAQGGVPDEDIASYLGALADRAALDAALNWYRAAPGGLGVPDCPDVAVTTLYLWGPRDASVGRVAASMTADHVRAPYRFVEVTGSGHFLADDGGAPTVISELLAHLVRASA
jgi:pimeloyl-ACP methyl ester carboxylesterase